MLDIGGDFFAGVQQWVAGVALSSIRISALLLMTPVVYAIPIPGVVRVILVFCLAGALASGVAPGATAVPAGQWFPIAMAQAAIGASMGLGVLLAFSAFSLAGNVLDIQIGFGMGQAIDPVSQRQIPILTSIFNMFALLYFYLIDAHHALVRAIALSFEYLPLGQAWQVQDSVPYILAHVANVFAMGFSFAAPVVLCVLLLEVALGVISRNLPQMNMFAVGIPLKIMVGLAALSAWAMGIGGVMNSIYASTYKAWGRALGFGM